MPINGIVFEGDTELSEALAKLVRKSKDLRPVFETIISDFYISNAGNIFGLKDKGQYTDLKDETKDFKRRSPKSQARPYPILLFEGRLRDSLTRRNDPEAIAVSRPTELILGTKVPYAGYHQAPSPSSPLPPRPVLLIDTTPNPLNPNSGEAQNMEPFKSRKRRWLRIIETAITRSLRGKK